MFRIRLAQVNIGIENKYPFVEELCAGYLTLAEPDFCVSVTDSEIEAERASEYSGASREILEALAIYRKIALKMLDFDAFLLHAAIIEKGGRAYAFTAKSGVGKSTHIRIWKKVFGDSVSVINGDKPLIRLQNGIPVAYGTPWAGKEGWQTNSFAPLSAVCFLDRAEKNSAKELDTLSAISPFMSQILYPDDATSRKKTVMLAMKTLASVSKYSLHCNMEDDAAKIAYEKIKSE